MRRIWLVLGVWSVMVSRVVLAATTTITGSPITLIMLDTQGGRHQLIYNSLRQLYPNNSTNGDSGITIFVNGTSYGFRGTATGGIVGANLLTVVSQSALLGSGTLAAPWRVETDFTAGTGVSIRQTVYYVNGDAFVTFRWDVTSTTNQTNVRFFHGMDAYNNSQDNGYGAFNAGCGGISVSSPQTNPNFFQQYIPITPITSYQEATYNTIWNNIRSGTLTNTVNTAWHDAAMAHQWTFDLQANVPKAIFQKWAFGPSACNTPNTLPPYLNFDFGDAPSSFGTLLNDGAGHVLNNNIRLGASIDRDQNGFSNGVDASGNASDDDLEGTDDEDAFTSLPVLTTAATSYTIPNIPVFNNTGSTAYLVGWIDFNQSGTFDSNEAATVAVPPSASAQSVGLTWSSLPGITLGTTYARFRLTTDTIFATGVASTSVPVGIARDGEVEDYQMIVGSQRIGVAKAFEQIIPASSAATNHDYTLVYRLTLKNFGDVDLTNLELFDNVLSQFSGLSPRDFNVWVNANLSSLSPAPTLNFNPSWTGAVSNNALVNGQSLAVGQSKHVYISFVLTVNPLVAAPNNQLRNNQATARGSTSSGITVSDLSTNGLDPDPNGNNNPSESVVTPAAFVKLVKSVRNCGNSLMSCSGSYLTSVTGLPGDYLEYRIRYYNISSQSISTLLVSDTLVPETPFQEDTYSIVGPEIADFSVVCPDSSVIEIDVSDPAVSLTLTGSEISAFDINVMVATVCNLSTIAPSEQGYLLFKVKIP